MLAHLEALLIASIGVGWYRIISRCDVLTIESAVEGIYLEGIAVPEFILELFYLLVAVRENLYP